MPLSRPASLVMLALASAAALAARPFAPASALSSAPSALTATEDAPNTLTAAERKAGWRLLFDGKTLAGWRGIGRKDVPAQHWTVENGAIKKIASGKVPKQADGQPAAGGDLMTDATFGDFELTWEWKVTPGANSGVKYNVSEEISLQSSNRAALGFEYQVLDDDRHPDGKLVKHRTGDLYDLIAANEQKHVKPVGEWNQSRLVYRGTHGEHWLNGAKVVDYDLGTARMDSALKASKYKSIAGFGDRRRGHLVLQDHGDEVYFRSLKLRELGASTP